MDLLLKFLCILTVTTNFALVQGKILNKKVSNNNIYKQVVYHNFPANEHEIVGATEERTKSPEPTKQSNLQERTEENNCSLPEALIAEIQSYSNISNLIISMLTNGVFKGKTYKELRMLKHFKIIELLPMRQR